MSEQIEIPAEDCRRAAALLLHVAAGDQAGYEMVGAEAAAAGRMNALTGALVFVIDNVFGEQLRSPEVRAGLQELVLRCEDEGTDQ